jgi:hypothetical protein
VAQTVDSAAIGLRARANRVAGFRHTTEGTRRSAQHTFAEELLGAMPATRQSHAGVDCCDHGRMGAIAVPHQALSRKMTTPSGAVIVKMTVTRKQ